ncbi:MAG: hypothetical protein RL215_546 [Planctomycetota bacterium]
MEVFVVFGEDGVELLSGGVAEELGCFFRGGDGNGSFFEDEVMKGESFSGDDLFAGGMEEEFFGFVEEVLWEPLSEDFGGLSDFGIGTASIDIDAEEQRRLSDGGSAAEFDSASSHHECFVAAGIASFGESIREAGGECLEEFFV